MPAGPWSTNAHNGWVPNPRLNVGAAPSLSEWAVIRVASRSTISGRSASTSHVRGSLAGPRPHHGPRRGAGGSIAASTRSASAASTSIVRDTVGSEATGPNSAGSARSSAISARQSPPSASVTAKSSTILAG